MGPDGLRAVIDGPARLAALDVSEVREAMVAEARDEAGALPLVENALHWLWEPKRREGDRLSGQLLTEQGGLAGILSQSADDLLRGVDRDRALELLFQLVNVDPEGVRHTRRRIPLTEALDIAGGGEPGRSVVDYLAGTRARDGKKDQGPLRLITVTAEGLGPDQRDWVSLIHETLIRSKGVDADGKPQGYWPTLWTYLGQHRERAAWRQRLQADTRMWVDNGKRGELWSHERVREALMALTRVGPELHLSDDEMELLGPTDPTTILAEVEQADTPHLRRAFLGERLAILGDPRPGVGVDRDGTPDIEWCAIPGGEVAIQVNRRLLPGTKPRRKRVEAFHIARYPVTATQYRAFLRAEDGWQNPQWWVPDLYRDPEGDSYDVGRYGNHPALYVSWFDAMAFCRWLSGRLGTEVRLADEWEWQQAATGGNAGNVYPWGGDWDTKREPHRANTFEGLLGRATAVGMYPDGASLHGAQDMAGTVWEWCLNKFEQPEVIASSGNDLVTRALRGGSWDGYQVSARCAGRGGVDPDFRDNHVGFRVLCSSPIVEP
jgi:formylglycine-generating enzyme required for sulfatase activity